MKRNECPICGNLLVMPRGPEDASILMVGSHPGYEELKQGIPWVGNAGKVLKKELQRVGMNFDLLRVTNAWMHYSVGPKEPRFEDEFDYHMKSVVEEAQGKKAILLMGAIPVKVFTGYNVSEVEGLVVKSTHFPDALVMACRNPAAVLNKGAVVGNVRHTIERFGSIVKEMKDG